MDAIIEFLNTDVAGQKLWQVMIFFVVVLVSLVAGRLLRFVFERAGNRAEAKGREMAPLFLKVLAKPLALVVVAAGLNVALMALELEGKIGKAASVVSQVLATVAVGYTLFRLVDVLDHFLLRASKRTASKLDDMLTPLVGRSLRVTIVALVVMQVAQAVFDKPAHSIIAGLGVGGLAIALAGQDTIKNFFGSLVILADKPFEIGDRVVIDGHDGPVENVGFRSTRIRRTDGHLVTVPNAEIVNKTVENVGKRPYIRRWANITITYDTPPDKVDRAVAILKEILADHQGMKPEYPPRVFFSDFGDWALNITMVYWYHPPDYWQYLEFSEQVNRQILRRFNEEGIEFAFPSQTMYLANDDKRQLAVRTMGDQS